MNMRLATLILLFLTASACVSTRKKGEASRFSKAYHNVTGKYNGFFNANILLQESIDKLNAQHRDNYNKLLDVYPYLAVDNPKAVSPDLDKAIEKVAVVATVHRVGHWTDDSYLLLGRAQFLKQDFESAEETFGFLTEEYNPSNIKSKDPKERKKAVAESKKAKEADAKTAAKDKKAALKLKEKEREERIKIRKMEAEQRAKDRKSSVKKLKTDKSAPATETVKEQKVKKTTENGTPVITNADKKKRKINPDNYLFRHRPSYQEGMLWMARTLIERQKYDDAQFILEDLDKNAKTFRDVRGQLALAFAHLCLKQNLYEETVPHLIEALKSKLGKKEKVRAAYILAQLHQRANRNEQAFTAFDKVLDYAPLYEMEFNARLNMALNGNTTNEVAAAGLNRMAKDFKNQEYLDQIYFALGQLSLKNGKKADGIQYLEKALATGGSNPSVKAEAYYTLAKSYYESENYVKAKMYYDSTATALDKSDTRKDEVKNYAENLTEIAQNISTIELKDSLLRISNMSIKEQRGLAARIKKNQDDAALAALMKLSAPESGGVRTADKTGAAAFATVGSEGGGYSAQSSFFAYNPETVRKGKREFEKRWGIERKLEDNWRRSNRRTNSGTSVADNTDAGSSALSEKEVNAILKDVPRSPADIESANSQVAEAMFQLGVLYHDKLKNYKKAIDILEKYNTRFPAGKEELTAWYYLYLSHMDLGEKGKAQSYYDKIQTKYADSNYAKVLRDPNALKNKDEQKVERYYDSTYVIFSKGQYKEAAEKIIAAEQLFGGAHPFKAKFALMNAMCLGNLKGKTEYINALREVVGRFGTQPEGKKASEILQILSNVGDAPEPEKQPEISGSPFFNRDESPHFVMVLAEKTISLEDAKVGVSDYNSKYHRLDDLRLSSIFLDSDAEIAVLLVRKFSNKAAALAYTDGVSKNKVDFLPIQAKYQLFAIHQDNYREVIKQKSVVDYAKFYESNYKK